MSAIKSILRHRGCGPITSKRVPLKKPLSNSARFSFQRFYRQTKLVWLERAKLRATSAPSVSLQHRPRRVRLLLQSEQVLFDAEACPVALKHTSSLQRVFTFQRRVPRTYDEYRTKASA